MINLLIAYDIVELEKKKVLSEAKNLYKSKILSLEQWKKIGEAYHSKLYSPSIFIRILFFILTIIGLSSVSGPIGIIFSNNGLQSIQIISLLFGIVIIIFTEWILIKKNHHYLSGITEAGIYVGLSFIAFGLLASTPNITISYPLVGLLLSFIATVRYLNLLALVAVFFFLGWILFEITNSIGDIAESLLPFIFMTVFGLLFWCCNKLKAKLPSIIFNNHFIIAKTLSLIVFYAAGNYYVVRELSIELLGIDLSTHKDIPFAYLFYFLTVFVPVAYIYFGVKQKSILLIRTGLLTILLSVITLKYYFSLGFPVLTVTVSGAMLIAISFLLFNYLKKLRKGYTSEKLLQEKWSSGDLTAIIASQTLGGNKMTDGVSDDEVFNGGKFGGAGGGGEW